MSAAPAKTDAKIACVSAVLNDNGEPLSSYSVGPYGDAAKLPFRLVINQGEEQGVKRGDVYLVYSVGDEIRDPETGAILGKLEILRGRGEVVHIMEKMSILRSMEQIQPSANVNALTALQGLGIDRTREADVPFRTPKIGDLARKISK